MYTKTVKCSVWVSFYWDKSLGREAQCSFLQPDYTHEAYGRTGTMGAKTHIKKCKTKV